MNLPDEWYTPRRWNPVTGRREIAIHYRRLGNPYGWKNMSRVWVSTKSDLFDPRVPDGFLAWAWMAMTKTGQHDYRIPTMNVKRAEAFLERWNDLSGESHDFKGVRGPDETRAAHPSGRGQLFAAYLDHLLISSDGIVGGAWPTFDWMEGPRWWPRWPLWNVKIIEVE